MNCTSVAAFGDTERKAFKQSHHKQLLQTLHDLFMLDRLKHQALIDGKCIHNYSNNNNEGEGAKMAFKNSFRCINTIGDHGMRKTNIEQLKAGILAAGYKQISKLSEILLSVPVLFAALTD